MGWWRSIQRTLKRGLELSAVERRLFAHSWVRLIAVDVSLRLRGLSWTRRWLARWTLPGADRGEPVLLAVARAGRVQPWRMRCLARALVLESLVEGAELRIGVRKTDEGLEAHAWVERNSSALGEAPAELATYRVLVPQAAREGLSTA